MCRCSNSVPFHHPHHLSPIPTFLSVPFYCPPPSSTTPPFLPILTPLAGLLLAIAWRAPPILSTPFHPGVLSHDVEPHPGPVLRHHYPFSGARAVCLLHRRCVLISVSSCDPQREVRVCVCFVCVRARKRDCTPDVTEPCTSSTEVKACAGLGVINILKTLCLDPSASSFFSLPLFLGLPFFIYLSLPAKVWLL